MTREEVKKLVIHLRGRAAKCIRLAQSVNNQPAKAALIELSEEILAKVDRLKVNSSNTL
jgi:hypothetical protein